MSMAPLLQPYLSLARQPLHRILVVNRPWRDDDERCEQSSAQANVECEEEVLEGETDEEGNDLETMLD